MRKALLAKKNDSQGQETKIKYMINTLFLGTLKSETLPAKPTTKHPFLVSQSARLNSHEKCKPYNHGKKLSSGTIDLPESKQFRSIPRETWSSRPKSSTGKNPKLTINKSVAEDKPELVITETVPDVALQEMPNRMEKALCSTKSIGIVKGYGVNSHKFYVNPYLLSQARICIISNLTKTVHKQQIISFFSLFQANKSPMYLDFIREHLHGHLAEALNGYPLKIITGELVQTCIKKIQRKFCECNGIPIKKMTSLSSEFDISYAFVFVRYQTITIMTKGTVKVQVSCDLGSRIESFSSEKLRWWEIFSTNKPDFLTLTSEAINLFKLRDISSCVWKWFLKQIEGKKPDESKKIQQGAIHEILGKVVNQVIEIYGSNPSHKNISVILVAFDPLNQMLIAEDNLFLPYKSQS